MLSLKQRVECQDGYYSPKDGIEVYHLSDKILVYFYSEYVYVKTETYSIIPPNMGKLIQLLT